MKAVENAIYCSDCAPKLMWGAEHELALRPLLGYEGEGSCRGCGKVVDLCKAHKVVKRKMANTREEKKK